MKKDTKRLLLFLGINFTATWLVSFLVIYPLAAKNGYGTSPVTQLAVACLMFFPTLSMLLTRLLSKEGFSGLMFNLKNLKSNAKYYIFAWIGMQILATIGAVVYFLIFPSEFSSEHKYILENTPQLLTSDQLTLLITSQSIAAFLIAPILNFIPCLGEEWGWRGYMMPKLRKKMSFLSASLVGGLIWGIWHAPIIAIGHNYGTEYVGAPWIGILVMCLFCVALGTILTYITEKTGSVIPATLAHGAINGFAAAPLYFAASNSQPIFGPTAAGLIGMVPMLILALILMFKKS